MKRFDRYPVDPEELVEAIENANSEDELRQAVELVAHKLSLYPPYFTAIVFSGLSDPGQDALRDRLCELIDDETYRNIDNYERFERLGGEQVYRIILNDQAKKRDCVFFVLVKIPSDPRSGSPGVPHCVVIAKHKTKEIIRAARGQWIKMEGK